MKKNDFIVFHYKLKDLFGWSSRGLVNLIKSMGLIDEFLVDKSVMDSYKKNIEIDLFEKPFQFFEYGMNDSFVLLEIVQKMVLVTNKILVDVYLITNYKYMFTTKNIPFTLGALVNKIFNVYIDSKIFQNDPIKKLAFLKHGILNELDQNYSSSKESFEILSHIKNMNELKDFVINNQSVFQKNG